MRTLFRTKRKIKWIMAMLVIGMLSGKAEAAELNTTEVAEAGDESGYEFLGLSIRIGEMKDGLFVRGYYEEIGFIFKELSADERTEAFDIMNKARKLNSLTPEMESAGYVIDANTGLALSPEDYANMYGGDAGENAKTPAPVDENTRFGFVTFAAAVEDIIHEPCFVGIKDENGGYQEIDLYEANGFTTLQQLPVGTYTITEGGITADFTGKYPLKYKENTFEITENCSIIVPLAIGDVDIPGQKIEETPEPTQAPEATGSLEATQNTSVEQSDIQENENNEKSNAFGLMCGIAIIIIGGIAAYVIYNKKK